MKKNTTREGSAGSRKKGMSKGQAIALGGGVAAATAIGAGAYYLMGPKAKTHQRKARMLLTKMKREAKQKVAKVKDITEPLYSNTVDALAAKYSKEYNAHEREIRALAGKLKGEFNKKKARTKKAIKRTIKKAR